MAPVTVFLVAIACLLTAAAAVRPLALRSGVPEAVWLILLGVGLRATGLVSTATIAALAPFFAAIALIMVLFEAGRDMVFGASGEQVGRARKLALVGAGMVVPLVALFSQALSGLQLLPVWSWTHAFMLGALVLCTAPEVYAPTLYRRAHPGLVATLEREAAITGALAIAATAFCIDLLSLRVPAGKAYAAIAAGFGLGLAFGAFAGLLWITAIRRIGPGRGVYPYTLAAILALYVVTDTLGGIGALAVLVFGAVVSNAGPLVAQLFRPRGTVVEAADEDFRAALDDHGRTVEITRVLLFTFLGLGLGPPWGLVAMGIVLGLMLVVLRLLAARLVLRGVDDRTFSTLALGWPRGMLVAGLAALPHAAAVPGTESLTTLVFAAVATTCVAFAVAVSPLGHAHLSEDMSEGKGPPGHGPGDMSRGGAAAETAAVRAVAPASTVDELLGGRAERAVVAGSEGRRGVELVAGAAAVEGRGLEGAQAVAAGRTGEALSAAVLSGAPSERRAEVFAAEPVVSGRTVVAVESEMMGRIVVPAEPVVSGRTVVPDEPRVSELPLMPAEPVVSGRTVVPDEPAVMGRVVVPDEVAVSGQTVIGERAVSGRTLVPGEPVSGRMLAPDELMTRGQTMVQEPAVSGRTLVPGEPVSGRTLAPDELMVSGRTLVPGEPAPVKAVAEVPRFAPPGTTRSAERTVLRASGPGAPELVRHVFISTPAATGSTPATNAVSPVTRAPESLQVQPSAGAPVDAAVRTSGSTVVDALPSAKPSGSTVDAVPAVPTSGSTVVDASPSPKPGGSTVVDALPSPKPSAPTVVDALPSPRPSALVGEVAGPVASVAGLEVAVTFAASESPESTLKAPVVDVAPVNVEAPPRTPEVTTQAPAPGKEPPLLELLNEALLPPRDTGETKEG